MIFGESNYYYQFADSFENRLDYVYYHPDLEILDRLNSITQYDVIKIGDLLYEDKNSQGIISGKTPRGIEYTEDGISFLGATNVQNGRLNLNNVVKIPDEYHTNELASSQLKMNDVLISMAGHYIGKCCVYDLESEANINQAIARLRVDSNKILPKYLSIYLNTKYGQLGFRKYQHDVGQPNINLEEIKLIKVIVPKIEIQEKIILKFVEEEDKFFDLISKAENIKTNINNIMLAELKLDLQCDDEINYFFKTGKFIKSTVFYLDSNLMQDRMHFLYYHPRQNVIDYMKGKYGVTTLANICRQNIFRGKQPEYDEEGEIIVIKTADIKSGYIDYQDTLRVSQNFLELNTDIILKRMDILVTSTGQGSLGKAAIYEKDEPALIDGHISVIRINDNYDPYFIVAFLNSFLGQLQFEKLFTGSSGQIEIQPSDLGKIIIPQSGKDGVSEKEQIRIGKMVKNNIEDANMCISDAYNKWNNAKETFVSKITLSNI